VTRYNLQLQGSVGVPQIDHEFDSFLSEQYAQQVAGEMLVRFYPVYTRAVLFADYHSKQEWHPVCELTTQVTYHVRPA
jgi:hypothetical protein